MNLFLTGYRGCGKTEVGRRLAAMLQREWVDMDAVLAGRLGSSIADHVAGSGWASFRQAERRLLRELCGRDGLVVSTGGGVAADRQNATEMRRSGLVVWLRADPGPSQRGSQRMRAHPASVRRCDPGRIRSTRFERFWRPARPPTRRRPT